MMLKLQCITIEYMDLVTVFLQETVAQNDSIPGEVIAMQTFGDFLELNTHTHIHLTDGCFYGYRGKFRVAPP